MESSAVDGCSCGRMRIGELQLCERCMALRDDCKRGTYGCRYVKPTVCAVLHRTWAAHQPTRLAVAVAAAQRQSA